jgi:hypothetical protein
LTRWSWGSARFWSLDWVQTAKSSRFPWDSETSREFPHEAYRLAEGVLEVGDANDGFQDHFRNVYADCATQAPFPLEIPRIRCSVRSTTLPYISHIRFEDPEPLDALTFTRTNFPSEDYSQSTADVPGWRFLVHKDSPDEPVIGFRGAEALVNRRMRWQPFVANLAVHRLLRLQRHMLFFHAAALAVSGDGLLLVGEKGTGKTTTSLFLAAQGHQLLSDEFGAVCSSSHELVPFRRALSIREGPLPESVREKLRQGPFASEHLPDGTTRLRGPIGSLFPVDPAPRVPLKCIFFLRGFAAAPAAKRCIVERKHVSWLRLLGCCLYGASHKRRALQLLTVLSRCRTYELTAGPPQETADFIEKVMEQS